jgi:hypothetical protein|tara:strand:+ start:205 stop:771 length:567 start_codon:yes stop_codon:yes gene_type:complete
LLAGGTMTHTEFKEPKIGSTSWSQWVEENLVRAREIYEEATKNLSIITRKSILKANKESKFFISHLTLVDFICGLASLAVIGFASLFLLSGLSLIGYQVFLWMQSGIWSEFPIVVAFNFLFENTLPAQWLSNPESWIGLQKVVEWLMENIPLSVALIIPSIVTIGGMVCISGLAMAFRFYQFKKEDKN